jgi:hypothetical protein
MQIVAVVMNTSTCEVEFLRTSKTYPKIKLKFYPPSVCCNENPIYVFPEKELCGRSPNFHISTCL